MAITINLTYEAGSEPTLIQKADIQYACNQWIATLNNNLDINVHVWAVNMSATGLNAMCIPGVFQNANSTKTRPLAKLSGDIATDNAAIDLLVVMDIATPWVLGVGGGVAVNNGQYSLSTTIMHELCHGLGFLGLCNVNSVAHTGTYSDAATLIPTVHHVVDQMAPTVVIPAHFFPNPAVSGIAVITAFANLFDYVNPNLTKGVTADDYTAFTSAGAIQLDANGHVYTVLSQNPFSPFTTCDHISGGPYLMNPSTVGQYYQAPDDASKQILEQIGWTII